MELRDNDANINVAQTQFWSLAIERELAPSTIFAISYSGAHSVHLYDLSNVNLIGAGQAYLGDPLVTGTSPDGTETCPYTNPVNRRTDLLHPLELAILQYQSARQRRRE